MLYKTEVVRIEVPFDATSRGREELFRQASKAMHRLKKSALTPGPPRGFNRRRGCLMSTPPRPTRRGGTTSRARGSGSKQSGVGVVGMNP
jgi:hypothetical protein